MDSLGTLTPVIIYTIIVIVVFLLFLYFIPLGIWFHALVSGVRIDLMELIFMRWRKVPPALIVNALIRGTKAGLNLDRMDLEAHFLAGGNIDNVLSGMILSKNAGLEMDFKKASSADLNGINLEAAVKSKVDRDKLERELFE